MTRRMIAHIAEDFARDGYVVVRGLFPRRDVARIRNAFMKIAADGPVEGLSEIPRGERAYDPADPLARYPRMMHPHNHPEKPVGPLAMHYMLHPKIQALLEAFLGEEPVATQSMFYFKPPGARGQDLHQDNFYLRVSPGTCYAAWLAIDDADQENGGMVVVPGSQNLEIACPEKTDRSRFFTDHHVPVPKDLQEMPVDLKAGDVLFFNGSVIHGSYPNASRDRFRRAFICHYVPRRSAEISHYYKAIAFDGERIAIPPATGGGPCGVETAKGPH